MRFQYSEFEKVECKLKEGHELSFLGIHMGTNGDPCTTGCAFYNNGKCPGYMSLVKRNSQPAINRLRNAFVKTNAELAKEHGVSKRQIAKMRKAGLL